MSKLKIHIPGGERTRTLLCVVFTLVAALFVVSSGAAREATTASGSYQWPLKPFDQPHPIRGSFGDPRTVFSTPPTEEGLMTGSGKFTFHSGVDIGVRTGRRSTRS